MRLPLLAFVFGVLALVVLAAMPTLLLRRVSDVTDELTYVAFPALRSTNTLALAMEERVAAARSAAMTNDPVYETRLAQASVEEATALQTLQELTRALSPEATRQVQRIAALIQRRDDLEARIVVADPADYRNSLPQFDALTDSIKVHVEALLDHVSDASATRLAEETHLLRRARRLATALGLGALGAAVAVGWFAWEQRRLRSEVARALEESNRLGREAEHRRELLERVTESRTRLMRGFTHDVKNPLGAASGHLDLLADGIHGPMTEPQTQSIERARGSIAAALGLVEDLMELARAESGNLAVARAPTDLASLIHEVVDEYRAQAEAKGLALRVELPTDLPAASTDARRVRQVLGNLVSNAVKYTREGSIRVSAPHAAAVGSASDGRIAIHVDDTGPGIAAEKRLLVFEEFTRLDPNASKGAGVGLAISRRIALALGGEITLESERGKGSRFTLWIPLDG
jgi:signal transduction histidine kinase